MKRWIVLLLFFTEFVSAQTVSRLTLSQAYDLAEKNYPVTRQKDLVRQTEDITVENLRRGYLPQPTLSGQATYQSDVTGIDISLPGIKIQSPAKDQYKVLADLSQVISQFLFFDNEKVIFARFNQAKISKSLHKQADPRPCCADHIGKLFV